MYQVLAALVGALITLMYGVNSRFAGIAGPVVATLVIHVSGLIAVSIICLLKREQATPGRLPFYYYLGGFVGVGTVFASNYAFSVLSASLAVALGLLGQTLFSLLVDAVGFLGRKKYPITPYRVPGVALVIAGVAVMAVDWRSSAPAMLLALIAGALPVLSVSLNSELGLRKGLFRSTRVNYIVGLATTLVIVLALRPAPGPAAHAVASAGPLLAFGGGIMGVGVVTGMSLVFPRMQAFTATLLQFSGQALTGVLIDVVVEGFFDARKLIGTLVVLLGLTLNGLLGKRGEKQRAV